MCASPLSPRHAQPDWMGGGLVSRQMMHAPPSAAISLLEIGAGPVRRADEWGVPVRVEGALSMAARNKWPASQVPSHRWYGKQLCFSARRRSGHFMASACATMLIVAAGLVFRKRTLQTGAFAPRRNRHTVRLPLHPLQPLRRTR